MGSSLGLSPWLCTSPREYEEAERMAILDAWGVARDSKKRKVELMSKLWSSDTTQVRACPAAGHGHPPGLRRGAR